MKANLYVAGHRGMVGRAVVRALADRYDVTVPADSDDPVKRASTSGSYLDLRDRWSTEKFFDLTRPDAVVLAAGRVGGIGANQADPVEFLRDNILIGVNVLGAAHRFGVERVVNLGSSCIYPRDAPQPLREDCLMTGPLERTNEAYALAKIATLRLAQYYRAEYGRSYVSLMPTNLYGTGDRYDLRQSHVLPMLVMKFERARLEGGPVRLWGTGSPLREFLHVDDLAEAIGVALDRYDDESPLNVGSGEEVSIAALAEMVADATGYEGEIQWDASMPDGTPRKILDSSRIRDLGWAPKITLRDGIRRTVAEYRALQAARA